MFRVILTLCVLAVAVMGFHVPSQRASRSSLKMELEGPAADLVGNDLEFPDFDPWGFSKEADEEKMFWYRAAELKHGRVAMVAALGQITQYYVQIDDPVFNQGDKPFKALEQVLAERPLAAAQIVLAIFAVEALGQFKQMQSDEPGNLGFDPLGLRSDDDELWEKTQLRELKNGRLAMLAIAGMLYTETLTGNGVLEAWRIGAISPFNDGKGIF